MEGSKTLVGNYNVTGDRIKELRIANNYSLRGLCKDLEEKEGYIIDSSNLYRIEKGERQVTDILLEAIANLLKIDPGEFFKKKEDK